MKSSQLVPVENRLLAALPRAEYERLLPKFQPIQLPRGRILYESGDAARFAYFLNSGMVSLLSTTLKGDTIEVGMVGSEGVTGIPIILGVNKMPYRVMVQITADALRIEAAALQHEFNKGGRLQHMLLCYAHTLFTQIAQSAVCNRFHSLEERLCRWLLVSRDRVQSDTFELTQDFIAQMLGTSRSRVNPVAGRLRKAKLIRYSRGTIKILDKQGLEKASCECYGIVRDEIEHCLAA